ncbi:MAG: N-methyl-L-tryptophan oxidase [Pirellulaceae bacterium]|nr:N-methyl-L-tryptophan oxidase [Pirellulaceae bacterium]
MAFDLAVIGCGGIGSAVLYHAAKTGAKAIGIEQFQPVHDRGSSHGHTRIIRQAYFEHPDYVPLLLEAYQLWSELEQSAGQQLYVQTGLLQAGPVDGEIVPGVLRSAALHDLAVDQLTAQQAMERYPMFRLPADHIAAFEQRAGYLFVEQCVGAHLRLAVEANAQLFSDTRLIDFDASGELIRLNTDRGIIEARRMVMTVGAWLPRWMSAVNMPLTVLRKHLHWYQSNDQRTQRSQGCPLFFFENEIGSFYGFPAIDAQWGLKVAEHSGGESISDPATLDRTLESNDLARIEQFLGEYFHGELIHQQHAVCMYTMTKDQHFLIDVHPHDDRIWLAGGFSGHGFKFASVLGKLVSQAALGNGWDERLKFLRAAAQRQN